MKNPRIPRGALVALVGALTLASCAAAKAAPGSETQTSPEPASSTTSVTTNLEWPKTWPVLKAGSDYTVKHLSFKEVNGTRNYPLTWATRTELLSVGIAPRGVRAPEVLQVRDVATGKIRSLTSKKGKPRDLTIVGADSDSRWIVWTETTGNFYSSDWTVFSYDKRTKKTRKLATRPKVGKGDIPSAEGFAVPSIDRGVIYFDGVWSMANGKPRQAIYSVPANGSSPAKMLIRDAGNPTADEGRLVYHQRNKKPIDALYSRDLRTNETVKLDDFQTISKKIENCGWDWNEGVFVNCRRSSDGVVTLTVLSPHGRTVVTGKQETPWGVWAAKDFVGILRDTGRGYQQRILNLETNQLSQVRAQQANTRMWITGSQYMVTTTDKKGFTNGFDLVRLRF